MTTTRVTGWWNDTITVNSHTNKLAAIPSNCWLHEVTLQGRGWLQNANITITAGNWPQYNLSAGVQYGPAGYSVVPIADGTGGSANWVNFSENLPSLVVRDTLAGSSPLNAIQTIGYPYMVRWRGLLYNSGATDVYWVVGLQNAFTPVANFASDYSWSVVYST